MGSLSWSLRLRLASNTSARPLSPVTSGSAASGPGEADAMNGYPAAGRRLGPDTPGFRIDGNATVIIGDNTADIGRRRGGIGPKITNMIGVMSTGNQALSYAHGIRLESTGNSATRANWNNCPPGHRQLDAQRMRTRIDHTVAKQESTSAPRPACHPPAFRSHAGIRSPIRETSLHDLPIMSGTQSMPGRDESDSSSPCPASIIFAGAST